ncbi:unnamed protein product [Orchesella dallaii]|uniref:Uncharacterized protein n=1 Tax=Orchesella dallaii TaxID=48710 RepID=A0ABP1RAA7_9HEXA
MQVPVYTNSKALYKNIRLIDLKTVATVSNPNETLTGIVIDFKTQPYETPLHVLTKRDGYGGYSDEGDSNGDAAILG